MPEEFAFDSLAQDALLDVEVESQEPQELRLLVHFRTQEDRQAFSYLIGQHVLASTDAISWPVAGRLPPESLRPLEEVIDASQSDLLSVDEPWPKVWRGMPTYTNEDLSPYQTIAVYFKNQEDRRAFVRLLEQPVTDETKSLWFPRAEIDKVMRLRWRSTRPLNPRYPVYVPTKGRWDSAFTIKCLERLGVPYYAVVQPQEKVNYEPVVKTGTFLLLPEGLDGLVPTRNWIFEHAVQSGAERHWQLDDNIKSFFRYHENRQIHVADGTCMRIAEDFTDRYDNIAIAGFQYFMFVPRKVFVPPFVFNTRVYSNSLINNSMPYRYRDVYNDDTDICLRALKDGWCTIQFNAFLAWKQPTMRVKGGNTPIYLGAEAVVAEWAAHVRICRWCTIDVSPSRCEDGRAILQKDGRWRMADSLKRQHPDVTTITRRWNRWQHMVDYRRFRRNVPKFRDGVQIPEGQDDYGLELVEVEGVDPQLVEEKTTVKVRAATERARPALAGPSVFDFLQQSQQAGPDLAREPEPLGNPEPQPQSSSPVLSQPDQPTSTLDEALRLRASLEAKGHRLLTKDGRFLVSEASRLTAEDRAAIKQHRERLIELAEPWVESHESRSPDGDGPKREGQQSADAQAPLTSPLLLDSTESLQHAERQTGAGSEPADSLFTSTSGPQTLAQLLGTEPPRVDPDYRPDEFLDLSNMHEVVLNLETDGLRWWDGDQPIGVTIGTIDGQVRRFLPFGFAGGNLDREQVVNYLRRELRGKHVVNANTKFDVHMLRVLGVDLEEQGCTVSDVQHYAALLDDNRKKFNIDLLAEEMLGGVRVPRVDESRMATYHASEVAERARYQVELVAQLREHMWPKLDEEDLQAIRRLEDDVIYPVVEMEKNGVKLDVERLERWVKESGQQYDAILMDLYRETGRAINPDAPTDLEKLFEHLRLPIVRLASGAPSFTDAILKRIDHPLIRQVRFAVKLSDLRSRYLLKYQKAVGSDGILRYAMHQVRYQKDSGEEGGTGPGRFSSSELDTGVGCNIQQVIKVSKQRKMFGYGERDNSHDDEIYLIRRLMIPEEGQWLAADAMQIEYRMFAHYAGNKHVVEAYKQNPRTNFHTLIEGMIGPHVPRQSLSYDNAKSLNFATIYGAAQIKQAMMLGFITEEDAQDIRDKRAWNDPRLLPMKVITDIYNRELPEVKLLLKRAADLAETRKYVKTLLRRRSRFTTDHRYHKALNNVIQGGAADYCKVKLVEVHRARKDTGFVLRITVHDEIDGDAREPETVEKMRAILDHQSWPELKVPLLWDVNVGSNWAEAK